MGEHPGAGMGSASHGLDGGQLLWPYFLLPSTQLGDPSIDEASCLSPSVILAVFRNYVCVQVCMSVCTCMCVGVCICAHAWRLERDID